MTPARAEPSRVPVAARRPATAIAARDVPITAPSGAAKVLQRRFGNQGTQALLRALAAEGERAGTAAEAPRPAIESRSETAALRTFSRDAISQPGDALEQEAERVADQVMRMPQRGAQVATERAPVLQRSAAGAAPGETIPPIVHEVLRSPGRPLDRATRTFMEPRFGQDFGGVRVHTGDRAAEAASSIAARAFTSDRSVVFGAGEYAPQTQSGRRLLAHELAHVVQQEAGIQRQATKGQPTKPSKGTTTKDKPESSKDTYKWDPDSGSKETTITPGVATTYGVTPVGKPELEDSELGPEYQKAIAKGDAKRADAIDQLMASRLSGSKTNESTGPALVAISIGGRAMLPPEIAFKILDNVAKGEPPWKPELGPGGAAFFTTEGNPYIGVGANYTIPAQVEIVKGANPLIFRDADLMKIWLSKLNAATAKAEAQVRADYNLPAHLKIRSMKLWKTIIHKADGIAETEMWAEVGRKVVASPQKIGEVIFEPGDNFSRSSSGKFAIVADASKITLKGGTAPLIDALAKQGYSAEPTVVQAAGALAKKMSWPGRVVNVFRVSPGRMLIVIGVVADVIKIYYARDKLKAITTSAGGWLGATAASTAFAAWYTPADVLGPPAWVGHAVGTLIAGGIGYFIGSEVTQALYELVAE
jgi:uncharacterized protein DUF4157